MKRKCMLDKLINEREEIINEMNRYTINEEERNYNILKLNETNKYKLINGINIIKNDYFIDEIILLKKMINQIDFLHNIKIKSNDFLINTLNDYNESIKYNQNKNNIEDVKKLKILIEDLNKKILENKNKITEYKLKISNNNFTINNYNKNIQLKLNYENEIKIYDTLAKSVCIHGIPSIILNKYLEGIQNYMNNLISPFINKTVELVLDGNYLYINVYNENEEIINILGGMEHFIVNISLKITLGKLSVLPKCGLLIIDEGVSVLDKEHIENFYIFIKFLKTNYKNVIIISHIDGMMVAHLLQLLSYLFLLIYFILPFYFTIYFAFYFTILFYYFILPFYLALPFYLIFYFTIYFTILFYHFIYSFLWLIPKNKFLKRIYFFEMGELASPLLFLSL